MNFHQLKITFGFCVLFVILVAIFQHQVLYFLNPVFLEPDITSTRSLEVHNRHFYGADTVFKIEVHHVDWMKETDWCVQDKDGYWVSYFNCGD